jgi:hypothetical protein
MRFHEPIPSTYEAGPDTFPHWKWAVAPCAAVALFTRRMGNGFFPHGCGGTVARVVVHVFRSRGDRTTTGGHSQQ